MSRERKIKIGERTASFLKGSDECSVNSDVREPQGAVCCGLFGDPTFDRQAKKYQFVTRSWIGSEVLGFQGQKSAYERGVF